MKKSFILCSMLMAGLALSPIFADEPVAAISNTVLSQNFPVNNVKKLEIALGSESVSIMPSLDESFNVTVKSNYSEKNPIVTLDKKTLKINMAEKKVNLKNRECMVVISVPAKSNITDIKLDVASGSVFLDGVNVSTVDINLGKGGLSSEILSASKKFTLKVAEGTSTIAGISTKELDVQVKKGSSEIGASNVKVFSLKSEKGTSSLTLASAFAKESSLETSSGTINLILPESIILNPKTTIGNKSNYHSDFATDTNGIPLKVKVGNGTVNISKVSASL